MKVFFIVPYPSEGASNRFRVEQFLPYLRAEGIKYKVRPFLSAGCFKILYKRGFYLRKIFYFILGSLNRLLDLFRIVSYDVIFIHREAYPVGPAIFERIIKLMGKPIVFDFDDAIYLPNVSDTNTFVERFKMPSKTASIVRMSRYVIAGNNYLKNYALHFNKNVEVIPTCVDADTYCPAAKADKRNIAIGWIGSPTTVKFLHPLKQVFKKILEKYQNVEIQIVGSDFRLSDNKRIISKPWSLETELAYLRDFDIGIMPMPEDEWTLGKCGFKAILYMSIGIPCVVSPVGANKEIVVDGVSGFFAQTAQEWFEHISRLIDEPRLRQTMGSRARASVEEHYSVKANAAKFIDAIMAAHENKK